MNGAKAVLPVTTMSKPRPIRITTMGNNQNFFLTLMNSQNSVRIRTLLIPVMRQIS